MSKLSRLDPTSLAANPRASLSSWKRYEPLVIAAYNMRPQTYVYETRSDMSPATIASRLRDAVRGALAFEYPSEIPTADLLRWYGEVIIRFDKINVYIGPREPLSDVIPLASSSLGALTFSSLLPDELAAFVLLLGNGRIQGPVIVTQTVPTPTLSHSNVEIIHRPDGAMVLL